MDKRELFAALAMAGIFASGHKDTLETVTDDAIAAADMLIKGLRDSDCSLSPKAPTGSVNSLEEEISRVVSRMNAPYGDSGH